MWINSPTCSRSRWVIICKVPSSKWIIYRCRIIFWIAVAFFIFYIIIWVLNGSRWWRSPWTDPSADCNVASLLLDVLPPLLVSAELVAAPLFAALLLLLPPTPSLLFASPFWFWSTVMSLLMTILFVVLSCLLEAEWWRLSAWVLCCVGALV